MNQPHCLTCRGPLTEEPPGLFFGISLIVAERRRQVSEEGYTPEHDDAHDKGELAQAAMCYTNHAIWGGYRGLTWPWDSKWWKPGTGRTLDTRIRSLTKAGALIAAELDRLLRAKESAISNLKSAI